jgi:hypothetical protein
MNSRLTLRLVIYSLLVTTFCLGLPQIHYTVAAMIAVLIRHKDNPAALFTPINSSEIRLPWT